MEKALGVAEAERLEAVRRLTRKDGDCVAVRVVDPRFCCVCFFFFFAHVMKPVAPVV